MATGTSDDERDDELNRTTEHDGDQVETAGEITDEGATAKAGDASKSGSAKAGGSSSEGKPAKTKATKKPDKPRKADKKKRRDEHRRGPRKFLREVATELRKVVTPTKQELWRYVGVVLAFLLIMMVIVMVFDWIFGFGSSWVFGQGTSLFPDSWFHGADPTATPIPTDATIPPTSVAPTATP